MLGKCLALEALLLPYAAQLTENNLHCIGAPQDLVRPQQQIHVFKLANWLRGQVGSIPGDNHLQDEPRDCPICSANTAK